MQINSIDSLFSLLEQHGGKEMVRAFINGKEVRKEDLWKYEIKSEKIKRIISEKFLNRTEDDRRK